MPKMILADQKQRERISAMAHVFRKTDRVLTGDPIDVVVEDAPGQAPSWTDGKTITFNKAVIGSVTSIDEIIRLSGLNYHELAHCWYTPRTNSTLVKAIRSEGIFDAFNVLEDQRIETFLTSKHPSTIPYLVSTFMRFCIQSEQSWETNYALVYGRKFIPADVRAEFKRRFIKQSIIPQLEAVIDEYRTLVFPKDSNRGLELVRAFAALMSQIGGQVADPHGHVGGTRPQDVSGGRPATPREQNSVADSIDEMDEALEDSNGPGAGADDEDEDDDDGVGGAGSNSDSDDVDDFGDSSGDNQASFDSQGGGDSDSGDADQGDTNTTGSGGLGAGNSKGDNTTPLDADAVRAMLEGLAKQFENLPDVQEDAGNKQRAIVSGDGDIDTTLDTKGGRELPVDAGDVATARKFATVLDQLRADADPGWRTHTSSGKVNVQRVINGADYDKIWDRWIEGNNDAADIECVITIDTSGSMSYGINEASRAMWIIKRAMEIIDANVTVIAYNHDTTLVYKKEQKVNKQKYRSMKAQGSTMPRQAVTEAVRILQASRRHNKIFITITDGQWATEYGHGGSTTEGMIEAMGELGITTALAFIGYVSPHYGIDAHKCQIAAGVSNPMELVGFAKKIVGTSMKVKR